MRSGSVRFLLALLAVLALAFALKETVVPRLARSRLISAVQADCGTCELSVGRLRVLLWPPALNGSRVHFTGGKTDGTVVDVEAERVYLPFSLLPLIKSRLRIGTIEIERPSVTVTEGALAPSSASEDAKARPLDIEIAGIRVDKGAFVYLRRYPGGTARVAVSRITAEAGPVGSSARFEDADASASAEGLLEGSGALRLQVRARLQAEVPDLDVDLRLAGQDLSKLNPFLEPSDAITLKGEILEARSSVTIRGEHLSSSVYMRYRGLEVKVKQSEERGAVSAFFQNLMADVMIGKQNSDAGNYDRRGTAQLRRDPDETDLDFALRGMKEAALKVPVKGGN